MFVLCADRGVLIVQYRWELCPLRINRCLLSFPSHRQTYSSYIEDKVMAATPMAIHAQLQTWPALVFSAATVHVPRVPPQAIVTILCIYPLSVNLTKQILHYIIYGW